MRQLQMRLQKFGDEARVRQESTMDRLPDATNCERGSDLIAFLYGEIDERAARDFERHLLNCPDCESELGAFKQIRSSLVAWRQESLAGATAASLVAICARRRTCQVPASPQRELPYKSSLNSRLYG